MFKVLDFVVAYFFGCVSLPILVVTPSMSACMDCVNACSRQVSVLGIYPFSVCSHMTFQCGLLEKQNGNKMRILYFFVRTLEPFSSHHGLYHFPTHMMCVHALASSASLSIIV